jgi:uncharacterized membrane protein YedE/YeeE
MARLVAALAGVLFGLGLAISGMIDPEKVLGFLDISGDWDPSLAFVMGGAIPVAWLGFRLAARRPTPLCEAAFSRPTATIVDRKLVLGAALFGIGWGLAGFCPGPALASLGLGLWQVWLFAAAMMAGMALHYRVQKRQ